MASSNDKIIDAWIKQSELMWRTVYATPTVAIAIFAGWYVTSKDGNVGIARAVLFVGLLMMAIQWLTLHRMARYLKTFRDAVGDGLPHVPPAESVSIFGRTIKMPSGHMIATSVPIVLALLFLTMLLLSM